MTRNWVEAPQNKIIIILENINIKTTQYAVSSVLLLFILTEVHTLSAAPCFSQQHCRLVLLVG